MPSAPLYYQPLVTAAIRSAPVGNSNVAGVVDRQINFDFVSPAPGAERQIVPTTSTAAAAGQSELKAGIEKTLTALTAATDARQGAQLAGIKMSLDPDGYAANRALTILGAHPEALDTDSPDTAAQRALGIMQQVGAGPQDAAIEGGILNLPPALSAVLMKQWQGKEPVAAEEALILAARVGKQVEAAVAKPISGLAPGDAQALGWITDSTSTALSLWKGATGAMSTALGLSTDPAKVEEVAAKLRADTFKDPANTTLVRLLGMGGIDPENADQRPLAQTLLQGGSPHTALAAKIADQLKLPGDKVEWLAGRIVDLGGRPGNVDGLAAEIAKLAPPANPDPAPAPPPANPDPAPDPAPAPAPPANPDPAPAPPPAAPDPAPAPPAAPAPAPAPAPAG